MNLHELKNASGARKVARRLGRGHATGSGKTCGRGQKGQMSRKGSSHKAGFEGGQMPLIRRIPKRGFKNATRVAWFPVNVGALASLATGSEVTLDLLRQRGLLRGRVAGIKMLGEGDLSVKLTVKANAFSSTARTKIEAAGGVCEVV